MIARCLSAPRKIVRQARALALVRCQTSRVGATAPIALSVRINHGRQSSHCTQWIGQTQPTPPGRPTARSTLGGALYRLIVDRLVEVDDRSLAGMGYFRPLPHPQLSRFCQECMWPPSGISNASPCTPRTTTPSPSRVRPMAVMATSYVRPSSSTSRVADEGAVNRSS